MEHRIRITSPASGYIECEPLNLSALVNMVFYIHRGTTVEGSVIAASSNTAYSSATASTLSELYDFDLVKFKKLASEWKAKRDIYSSFAQDNILIPSYQKIIGMGESAIPLILNELKNEVAGGQPSDWFPALWAITDENPVPPEGRGKIREMAAAWLKWGAESGYIGEEEDRGSFSRPKKVQVETAQSV